MSSDSPDAGARRRLAQDLDTNVMVVAGAGTGKTTALVGRILTLVRSGVSLRHIAAITFTEAAAAELREQVRQAIESAEGDSHRMAVAGDEVDDAAICTLHAFAQRILLDQCVEAGLPPGFEVLDDTAEAADFEARWNRFADALLDDPAAERALVLGFSVGLRHTDLAAVAWSLHQHWDRLEDGGLEYLRAAPPCDEHWPPTDPRPVIEALDAALDSLDWCTDDEDNMAVHLRTTVADARAQLTAARPDLLGELQLLDTWAPFRCAQGRQENWSGHITEVRAACAEAEQIRLDLLDAIRRAVLGDLVARVAAFTLEAAEERRVAGRLTFHDLLVHARRLVRQGGDCLALLRQRYRRLLVDEFQDTDPIQVELAARIAAVDGTADMAAADPGSLFVVGDPKQSIYRFRRADIDLFDRVGRDIGSTVLLQSNFRSVPGIVNFVNAVFTAIFGLGTVAGQATHHALHAARRGPPGSGGGGEWGSAPAPGAVQAVQLCFDGIEGPDPTAAWRSRRGRSRRALPAPPPRPAAAVVTLGGAVAASTPEVRRRAAADAVTAISHAVTDGWSVEDTAQGRRRAARYGDVAVLIPARSSLTALEDALEQAGVPYRLEGAALLWGAEEVRDVLGVLKAADDPGDAVAVLGALRSPGLACGDDDLVTWHAAGGTWDPRTVAPPDLAGHPVAEAMAVLDRLHRRRWWSEPSAMVAAAYDELRSFELALSHRRPRDYWQRLRWLQDQARLFDEAPGGTLRAFLAWADRRAAGDGRVGGVGPPDPDDDAVRVMTIHGAKGLEFPIVILAGLERDQADGPRPPAVVWTEHGVPEIRVGRFRTAGFEQAGLREQRLDILEQHRLLYVGMTRARDHLVVCLHHRQRNGVADSSLAALVTRICAENPGLWRHLPATATTGGTGPAPSPGHNHGRRDRAMDDLTIAARWETDRAALLARLRRRPVTSATAVAEQAATVAGADDDRRRGTPNDPGGPWSTVGPPWNHDTSRRIGRAVHAALADLDLSTRTDAAGRSTDEVARACATAHGVAARAAEVEAMVGGALRSPIVTRAASRRSWREVSVTSPVGDGGVLEGVIDLLFEDDDGLVVVDYKTDRLRGTADGHDVMATHRLQVAAYAGALEIATGIPVARCVLLFVAANEPWHDVLEGEALAAARAQALAVADALVAS